MINLKGKFHNNKVDAEIDDYGDLSSFGFSGKKWEARVDKTETEKEKERRKYKYIGISQIGTSFPFPYTRDQLIKQRYASISMWQNPWLSIWIIFFAIVIDVTCYVSLIEQNLSDSDGMGFIVLLPAIGAAIAIDILPTFLAENLHRINCKRKTVVIIFSIISIILMLLFIAVMLIYRINVLNHSKDSHSAKVIWSILMNIIPLATTAICFISSYISYNPLLLKLKKLKYQELYIQENVFEIEAMLAEAYSLQNYKENLIEQDETLYNSAYDLIETIGEFYKSYIRTEIIPLLQSPADTSDLSADIGTSFVGKINLPII